MFPFYVRTSFWVRVTRSHRDGSVEIRTGPRPWRDNNPGDLEAGDFSKRHGMIGTEGNGRWAIFRDEKADFAALDSLLTTPKYQARTIKVTIEDYKLGRFLSVDPMISKPADSQSINPYSYIGNNTLSGTDPTGYFSTGNGCGRFAECDVTLVNPSDSSKRLYLGARDVTIVETNGHQHSIQYVPGSGNKGLDEALDKAGGDGRVIVDCGCLVVPSGRLSSQGADAATGSSSGTRPTHVVYGEEAKDRGLPGQYKPAGTVADLLVINNGSVPGNPMGHVAIGVTGAGVFSYGMSGIAPGSSVEDYIVLQLDRRNTTAYIIPTTAEQDAAALNYLSRAMRDPYKLVMNNCAIVCNGVLNAAGVGQSDFTELVPGAAAAASHFPVSAVDRAALFATQIIEFPKNAAAVFPLDPGLQQFDPVPSK